MDESKVSVIPLDGERPEVVEAMRQIASPDKYMGTDGLRDLMVLVAELAPIDTLAALVDSHYLLRFVFDIDEFPSRIENLRAAMLRQEHLGTVPLLLDELLWFQTGADDFVPDPNLTSISLEAQPDLTRNWLHRAWTLASAGDAEGAKRAYLTASKNLIRDTSQLSEVQIAYEALFTARLIPPGLVDDWISDLDGNAK